MMTKRRNLTPRSSRTSVSWMQQSGTLGTVGHCSPARPHRTARSWDYRAEPASGESVSPVNKSFAQAVQDQ